LTFANVVSCLALFVALGGSAFAATQLAKNSVGSKQLKKNAVTTAKIKKEAVTGAKIKLSSVGTVPSAAVANSLPPAEPIHLVGTPGQPPFENGSKEYAETTIPLQPVGFYKDREGIVHLEGVATVGNSSSGFTSIFTLPPGFRPAPGVFQIGGSGTGVALVAGANAILEGIPYNGNVLGTSKGFAELGGISFQAQG
jgi:hypothetical protein